MFLKAQREDAVRVAQAAAVLPESGQDPAAGSPEHVPAAASNLKNPSAAPFTYSYGPDGKPTDGYLDLLLSQLRELGVSLRIKANCTDAVLSGPVSAIPADVMESLKRSRSFLIARELATRVIWLRPVSDGDSTLFPDPDTPIEWLGPDGTGGECAGQDVPDDWVCWRHLYGEYRHIWTARSGLRYVDGYRMEKDHSERWKYRSRVSRQKAKKEREERERIGTTTRRANGADTDSF